MGLARYEDRFRKYASVSGRVNAGRLLAPSTRTGIWMRNRLFSVAWLFGPLMKIFDRFATDIDLEDYRPESLDSSDALSIEPRTDRR